MGQLKTTNLVFLAKQETTSGSEETLISGGAPAAGVSVIPVTEIPIPEIDGEELMSAVIQNGFQNRPGEGLTAKIMTVTAACEFAGPDEATGPTLSTGVSSPTSVFLPYYDVLMRVCGLTPTIQLDTPSAGRLTVRYVPDSDQLITTATIGVWVDGRLFTMKGARGDITMSREVGQKDTISFALSGAYLSVDDTVTALSVTMPTYTATVARSANFTFGDLTTASAICASSWEFAMQSEVTQRKCMNAEDGIASYELTNRDPQVTTTVEAFPISATDKQSVEAGSDHVSGTYYDVYAAKIAGTTASMSIDFDKDVANTKVATWTGTAQPTTVPHSDENGLLTHSGLVFRVVSTTKDGDFQLDMADIAYTA